MDGRIRRSAERLAQFEPLRPTLFAVAYQILGSVAEAEDAVQEAWVKYATSSTEPESLPAFLCTTVTRVSLDVVRSARSRRERYVGPWLPEPLPTDGVDGPQQAAELADSASMAALLLLERLTPLERAVFVLHDVFDFDYPYIAGVLDRSEAACRQLGSRARRHVRDGRPRFEADRRKRTALAGRFFDALQQGDIEALEGFLAADVACPNDGGGVAGGRGGVFGAARTARLLVASVGPLLDIGGRLVQRELNGQPGALLLHRDGGVLAAWTLQILDDRVQTIRSVTNPQKLAHLGPVADFAEAVDERNRARRAARQAARERD